MGACIEEARSRPTTAQDGSTRATSWFANLDERCHAIFTVATDLAWWSRTQHKNALRNRSTPEEGTVAIEKRTPGKRITLKLSPEQQKQIKNATGKNAGALELSVEELEERIAPTVPAVQKIRE